MGDSKLDEGLTVVEADSVGRGVVLVALEHSSKRFFCHHGRSAIIDEIVESSSSIFSFVIIHSFKFLRNFSTASNSNPRYESGSIFIRSLARSILHVEASPVFGSLRISG